MTLLCVEIISPDSLVSNYVLETEHTLIRQKLLRKESDKLIELEKAYNFRMKILVAEVTSGILTIDRYLKELKDSIRQHQSMATLFRNKGDHVMADRCVSRVKLMTQEVNSMQ